MNGLFLYSDAFQKYDLGPHHPLQPIRLKRTYDLLHSYGALDRVTVAEPPLCEEADLLTTHSADYLQAVHDLSDDGFAEDLRRFGFGTGDNPAFPGMWEASLRYTGASAEAARRVAAGEFLVAMNISGGLHHAHYDRAAGFCVLNDCAVAIHILRRTFSRVAYVDIDVHHGDGVQEAFYSDPSVLTVSIHETGQTLFPGTGFVEEIGEGPGRGFSLNVPVWPFTDDSVWLQAWREAAMLVLRAFDPQAVCLQLGTDAHYLDPLARVCLTAQGWLEAVKDVVSLGVPIVAVGGGGYNPTTVPRMWTLAFEALFGAEFSDETPASFDYRERIPTLTDHEEPPIAPHDREVARAHAVRTIENVRRTMFPLHGLPASSES